MRLVRFAVLGLVAVSGVASAQTAHHAAVPKKVAEAPSDVIKNVFWQPNALSQGAPALFTVELERPAVKVSGNWVGKELTFFKTDDPKVWNALAGNDLETQPGTFELKIRVVLAGGKVATDSKSIDVKAANFKTGDVNVPENFVEPDDAGKRQIAEDEAAKARAYAHVTPKVLWSGNFIPPVAGRATETFGESRILNEEKSSTHRGTDFPVNEGTKVVASNSGTVVLAKSMFYEGNCVIIDHGDRFFTIYMHLSKMDVKVGDKVKKGAELGLSGATGRVTGPHMHMGVRWNGAYLDPVQLLALTLPKTDAGETEKPPAHKTAARKTR